MEWSSVFSKNQKEPSQPSEIAKKQQELVKMKVTFPKTLSYQESAFDFPTKKLHRGNPRKAREEKKDSGRSNETQKRENGSNGSSKQQAETKNQPIPKASPPVNGPKPAMNEGNQVNNEQNTFTKGANQTTNDLSKGRRSSELISSGAVQGRERRKSDFTGPQNDFSWVSVAAFDQNQNQAPVNQKRTQPQENQRKNSQNSQKPQEDFSSFKFPEGEEAKKSSESKEPNPVFVSETFTAEKPLSFEGSQAGKVVESVVIRQMQTGGFGFDDFFKNDQKPNPNEKSRKGSGVSATSKDQSKAAPEIPQEPKIKTEAQNPFNEGSFGPRSMTSSLSEKETKNEEQKKSDASQTQFPDDFGFNFPSRSSKGQTNPPVETGFGGAEWGFTERRPSDNNEGPKSRPETESAGDNGHLEKANSSNPFGSSAPAAHAEFFSQNEPPKTPEDLFFDSKPLSSFTRQQPQQKEDGEAALNGEMAHEEENKTQKEAQPVWPEQHLTHHSSLFPDSTPLQNDPELHQTKSMSSQVPSNSHALQNQKEIPEELQRKTSDIFPTSQGGNRRVAENIKEPMPFQNHSHSQMEVNEDKGDPWSRVDCLETKRPQAPFEESTSGPFEPKSTQNEATSSFNKPLDSVFGDFQKKTELENSASHLTAQPKPTGSQFLQKAAEISQEQRMIQGKSPFGEVIEKEQSNQYQEQDSLPLKRENENSFERIMNELSTLRNHYQEEQSKNMNIRRVSLPLENLKDSSQLTQILQNSQGFASETSFFPKKDLTPSSFYPSWNLASPMDHQARQSELQRQFSNLQKELLDLNSSLSSLKKFDLERNSLLNDYSTRTEQDWLSPKRNPLPFEDKTTEDPVESFLKAVSHGPKGRFSSPGNYTNSFGTTGGFSEKPLSVNRSSGSIQSPRGITSTPLTRTDFVYRQSSLAKITKDLFGNFNEERSLHTGPKSASMIKGIVRNTSPPSKPMEIRSVSPFPRANWPLTTDGFFRENENAPLEAKVKRNQPAKVLPLNYQTEGHRLGSFEAAHRLVPKETPSVSIDVRFIQNDFPRKQIPQKPNLEFVKSVFEKYQAVLPAPRHFQKEQENPPTNSGKEAFPLSEFGITPAHFKSPIFSEVTCSKDQQKQQDDILYKKAQREVLASSQSYFSRFPPSKEQMPCFLHGSFESDFLEEKAQRNYKNLSNYSSPQIYETNGLAITSSPLKSHSIASSIVGLSRTNVENYRTCCISSIGTLFSSKTLRIMCSQSPLPNHCVFYTLKILNISREPLRINEITLSSLSSMQIKTPSAFPSSIEPKEQANLGIQVNFSMDEAPKAKSIKIAFSNGSEMVLLPLNPSMIYSKGQRKLIQNNESKTIEKYYSLSHGAMMNFGRNLDDLLRVSFPDTMEFKGEEIQVTTLIPGNGNGLSVKVKGNSASQGLALAFLRFIDELMISFE